MVEAIHPDAKGLVRTVTVKFKRKNKKEPKLVWKSGNLIKEKVAVQRLHFLVSANEGTDVGEDNLDVPVNSSEV